MTTSPSFAVVVPAYCEQLGEGEKLSLKHLEHFLPDAERFLVVPEGLDLRREGYREARFAPAFFRSIAGYNRLMLNPDFYARFDEYEFMLIHQLDALILNGDIERFLALQVDYLGAPWVAYRANGDPFLTCVGNGGLSLRRVGGFRRLLESPAPRSTVREYYRRRFTLGSRKYRLLGVPRAIVGASGVVHAIRKAAAQSRGRRYMVDYAAEARAYRQGGADEDLFISLAAKDYCPTFTFGSINHALEFAFETEPRFCLEQAGGRMPFGTHAWERYDRSFWEPFLLT